MASSEYPIRHTIYHNALDPPAVALRPPRYRREANRAVVRDGDRVLLVYSPVNGDYKFPGGGVEAGESHEQTLARELEEECGVRLGRAGRCLAVVTEYSRSIESAAELFVMVSRYYECLVDRRAVLVQALDAYEAELGFEPRWVTIAEAVAANRAVLSAGAAPRWTQRDTWMLETLGG